MLKKIEVNGQQFIIQAYKENEFVNLACNETFGTRIEFGKKVLFEGNKKETSDWRNWVSGIDIHLLISILNQTFNKEKADFKQMNEAKQLIINFD